MGELAGEDEGWMRGMRWRGSRQVCFRDSIDDPVRDLIDFITDTDGGLPYAGVGNGGGRGSSYACEEWLCLSQMQLVLTVQGPVASSTLTSARLVMKYLRILFSKPPSPTHSLSLHLLFLLVVLSPPRGGVSACVYHAGIPMKDRTQTLEAWLDNRVKVVFSATLT